MKKTDTQKPSWTQWIPYVGLYQILKAKAEGKPHICDSLDIHRELVEGRETLQRDISGHPELTMIQERKIPPQEVRHRTNTYQYKPFQYFDAVLWHPQENRGSQIGNKIMALRGELDALKQESEVETRAIPGTRLYLIQKSPSYKGRQCQTIKTMETALLFKVRGNQQKKSTPQKKAR